MPIYKPFVATALCAVLSGCLSGGPNATRNAPSSVSVTDADVVVAGPPGFCVDPDASKSQADSAFVLLASCAAISNQPLMPQPDLPVVLTASIATGPAPTPQALDTYFHSAAGVAHLREQGPVEKMKTTVEKDVFFVYVTGPKGDRWRGIIPLDPDVIVTVALRPTAQTPIPQEARFRALDDFAQRIVRANPSGVYVTKSN